MNYRLVLVAAFLTLRLVFLSHGQSQPQVNSITPHRQAHAHNDYLHDRPLVDALDHGFCSVEADIFLTPDGLLVAHDAKELKPSRTLQSLYLDPLRQRIQANGGRVHSGGPPCYLLIDVKTEAVSTYTALDKILAQYADILSVTENNQFKAGAVTIILSGNRAFADIANQSKRYVAIDGRPEDLKSNPSADLYPWISGNWNLLFKWKGSGEFPAAEKQKLHDFVRQAHAQKRMVRFWATPETESAWSGLLAANVDLINTDKLAELNQFLTSTKPQNK